MLSKQFVRSIFKMQVFASKIEFFKVTEAQQSLQTNLFFHTRGWIFEVVGCQRLPQQVFFAGIPIFKNKNWPCSFVDVVVFHGPTRPRLSMRCCKFSLCATALPLNCKTSIAKTIKRQSQTFIAKQKTSSVWMRFFVWWGIFN